MGSERVGLRVPPKDVLVEAASLLTHASGGTFLTAEQRAGYLDAAGVLCGVALLADKHKILYMRVVAE